MKSWLLSGSLLGGAVCAAIAALGPHPQKAPQGPPEQSVLQVVAAPVIVHGDAVGVGRLVPDFSFTALDGRKGKLSDFNNDVIVLALTDTSCPLCLKFSPSLARLEDQYRNQNVAFLFVNPNAAEETNALQKAIRTHGFDGPYIHDKDDRIAKLLKAKVTTEVFVLDRKRTLVYRGALDDQYGLDHSWDAPRNRFAALAIEATLRGKSPDIEATDAPGCALGLEFSQANTAKVDFHGRISRILQKHCVECHRPQGVAPFRLDTYRDAKERAPMIAFAVDSKRMPPWFAAPVADLKNSPWKNDRTLLPEDVEALKTWAASGAPEGNPADAPLPRTFQSEWSIGKPDTIYQIPSPIAVKAEGRMPYQNVFIDPKLTEDRWVQALEVLPTEMGVVHHILIHLFPPDDGSRQGRLRRMIQDGGEELRGFFAAYVPGNSALIYPDGFAKKLPKGYRLRFQIHYTPNGTAVQDQSRLGIVWAKTPPKHEVRTTGVASVRLDIPPGAQNHIERASVRVPTDARILSYLPHMHVRGSAFKYELVTPNEQRQLLLDVPRYDFNWQLNYILRQPLDVKAGSRIDVTAVYDNSERNADNPDPTARVRFGTQTEDEMLIGYIEYYLPNAGTEIRQTINDWIGGR